MSRALKLPTGYKGYILRPLADGTMDLIDPLTGMWSNFATQRHAKWSASVIHNIHNRLTQHTPMNLDRVPKATQHVLPSGKLIYTTQGGAP